MDRQLKVCCKLLNKKHKKRVKSAYGLTDIILINNCLVDRLSADLLTIGF